MTQANQKSALSNLSLGQCGPDAVCQLTGHITGGGKSAAMTFQRGMHRGIISNPLGYDSRKTNQTVHTKLCLWRSNGPFEVAGRIGSGAQWPGARYALLR